MSGEGLCAEGAVEKVGSKTSLVQKAAACPVVQARQATVQSRALDQPASLLHGWSSPEETAAPLEPNIHLHLQ